MNDNPKMSPQTVEDYETEEPVFSKPVDLKPKVKYTRNGIDDAKLQKAEVEVKEELRESYDETIRNNLNELIKAYKSMEKAQAPRKQEADRLFQVVHQIRGQGGTFGYDLVSSVANNFCKFLEKTTEYDDYMLLAVKLCVDTLHVLIARDIKGNGGEMGDELVNGLVAVQDKIAKKAGHKKAI